MLAESRPAALLLLHSLSVLRMQAHTCSSLSILAAGPTKEAMPRVVPAIHLTQYEPSNQDWAWSVDGWKLVFVACPAHEQTHLIVRAVDLRLMYGTALRVDLAEASITPGSDDSPVDINLSADAKFCAFRILDGEAVTWVFSTETGELVLETDDLYDGTKPFWHPEQPQFVQFMDASLTLYDLDTGESRILVTVPMMPEDTEYQADMNRVCCWSPCGKLVAYSYFSDTPEEGLTVAVARADGSGVLHAFHNLSNNFFGYGHRWVSLSCASFGLMSLWRGDRIRLYNLESGTFVTTISCGLGSQLTSVDFIFGLPLLTANCLFTRNDPSGNSVGVHENLAVLHDQPLRCSFQYAWRVPDNAYYPAGECEYGGRGKFNLPCWGDVWSPCSRILVKNSVRHPNGTQYPVLKLCSF